MLPSGVQVEDGHATPMDEGSTSSDDDGHADGPVLDIFTHCVHGDEVSEGAGAALRSAAGVSVEPGDAAATENPAPATAAVDDMFADELPVDTYAVPPTCGEAGENGGRGRGGAALADSYDDNEGYYKFQVNVWGVWGCMGWASLGVLI